MHILIAPNAFKNALDAASAAKAIAKGFNESRLTATTREFPVGDGGDGTGALLMHHHKGKIIPVKVHDPLGRMIDSSYGLTSKGKTAIIEMADASGLRLLKPKELNPLHANSFGTGELIRHALDKGVNKIILCIGGSASVDGGSGILRALGVRFLDAHKNEIVELPRNFTSLATVDLSNLDNRLAHCEFIILCDVSNYLLGPQGAAPVFGPQKGADEKTVLQLENNLAHFHDIILRQTGKDMSIIERGGAAGGVAASLAALLNAQLVNGIDYFLEATEFTVAMKKADLVITGEGEIDDQTLNGKAPFGVAKKAKQQRLPVIALAGKIPSSPSPALNEYFDSIISINTGREDIATAIKKTATNLCVAAKSLGNKLADSYKSSGMLNFS